MSEETKEPKKGKTKTYWIKECHVFYEGSRYEIGQEVELDEVAAKNIGEEYLSTKPPKKEETK